MLILYTIGILVTTMLLKYRLQDSLGASLILAFFWPVVLPLFLPLIIFPKKDY